MKGTWNANMYEAAQRAWKASAAAGLDDETRKALERLSAKYFFGACGLDMIGESATGLDATPSPCARDTGRAQEHDAGGPARS
jgi:hypothetical protein